MQAVTHLENFYKPLCIKAQPSCNIVITTYVHSEHNMISRTVSCESELDDTAEVRPITFSMGSIIPSQSSVVSNISSLYEKYTMHLNIIKWTGAVILLTLMSTSLALTSAMTKKKSDHTNYTDCIKIKGAVDDQNSGINNTLCGYFKQFPLPEQLKVTICSYQWCSLKQKTMALRTKIKINHQQSH